MKNLINSITLKIISIGVLILMLLIPTEIVVDLIRDRHYTQKSVTEEISSKWANPQTIAGGFFIIPFKHYFKDKDGKTQTNIDYLYLLPKSLNIKTSLNPQIRYRGIYKAVLYTADINIKGEFDYSYIDRLNLNKKDLLWEQATFSVGIGDMRGVEENIKVDFGDKSYFLNSGLANNQISNQGAIVKIPISPKKQDKFLLNLKLKGSKRISFTPIGEVTKVSINSLWNSPSFIGAYLPKKRAISTKDFNASWKVLHLNRNFPQAFHANSYSRSTFSNSNFGVNLLITTDVYQKTTRVAKYALLFIVLTFTAFFFSEIITKSKIHPIQYLLVGFAIVLFYVLLLALSEHVGFDLSYLCSSSLITILITLFANSILKNRAFTLTIFAILTILYGFLFMVLQLEDYALLAGSIGLFIVLSIIMYITRNINWYDTKS